MPDFTSRPQSDQPSFMNSTMDVEEPLTAPKSKGPSLKSGEGVKVEKTITINRPVAEVYAYWRQLENLPQFMKHLISVTELDNSKSHWVAQTPVGQTVEWDAQIIEDKRDEVISWQSLPGSELENAGSVRFSEAVAGRGTVLRVLLKYAPAGGKLGKLFAKFFKTAAKKEIAENLFAFKSIMETGEKPTIDGQPKGGEENRSKTA